MIDISNLEIGYQNKRQQNSVFKNMNMSFNAGDFVGLMGDNGVGKSKFLKTITGTLAPLSGEIKINGKHITQSIAQFIY
jgi:ABC-type cobalamin/Fe3+-siderophores transport system ATPase subunit